jgi:hypothetical protein
MKPVIEIIRRLLVLSSWLGCTAGYGIVLYWRALEGKLTHSTLGDIPDAFVFHSGWVFLIAALLLHFVLNWVFLKDEK